METHKDMETVEDDDLDRQRRPRQDCCKVPKIVRRVWNRLANYKSIGTDFWAILTCPNTASN